MKHVFWSVLILIQSVTVWGQRSRVTSGKRIEPASKAQKIEALMQQYHLNEQFDGAWLVAESDKNIYKGAVGWADRTWNIPNRVDTKFGLASNTKQFAAALIMQLVEQGKIRLDGKITDYLPEYPKQTGDRITVHQLLTHTSGIPSYTQFPDTLSWMLVFHNPYSPAEYVKRFSQKKLDFEPGTGYNYNNSGYYLLGLIIERMTGKSFEEAIADNILKPTGMTHSGCIRRKSIPQLATTYYASAPTNNPFHSDFTGHIASGDMYSTVEDLFKWHQALFSNQVLSATSARKLLGAHVLDTLWIPGRKVDYGYGIATMRLAPRRGNDSLRVVFHTGHAGYSSITMRLLDDKYSILLLSNIRLVETPQYFEMIEAIINILYDQPYTLPKPSISVALRKSIEKIGVQQAIKHYPLLKKACQPDTQGHELNRLGYYYLDERQVGTTIEVFKLYVREFSKDPNAYDSLAEAFLKNGDKQRAIEYYEKAVAIDSTFKSSIEALKKLKG